MVQAFREVAVGGLDERVLTRLRKRPATLPDLAHDCGGGRVAVRKALRALLAAGYSIHEVGDHWQLEQAPPARRGEGGPLRVVERRPLPVRLHV